MDYGTIRIRNRRFEGTGELRIKIIHVNKLFPLFYCAILQNVCLIIVIEFHIAYI